MKVDHSGDDSGVRGAYVSAAAELVPAVRFLCDVIDAPGAERGDIVSGGFRLLFHPGKLGGRPDGELCAFPGYVNLGGAFIGLCAAAINEGIDHFPGGNDLRIGKFSLKGDFLAEPGWNACVCGGILFERIFFAADFSIDCCPAGADAG